MKTDTIHISSKMVVHLYNGNILSVQQTKQILGQPDLSDDKATEIRDGFRRLVEVIYDKAMEDRRKARRELNAKKKEDSKQKI